MGVWLLHAPPALTLGDERGDIVVWDSTGGAALVRLTSIDIIIDYNHVIDQMSVTIT
jgi:hypothetical protein